MKKVLLSLLFALASLSLTACDQANTVQQNAAENKVLRIGVSPGPYNDLFDAAVKPILEAKGYQFKKINFSGLLESDIALNEGSIDFNVAQHSAYLNVFNQQHKADLVAVVHVPSVPAGIYSDKYKDLNQIKPGAKVAIPVDPSNAARAYNLLEKAGWIKLKAGVNPIVANKHDIAENAAGIDIVEIDSSSIPRIMQDIDYAVLPGAIVSLGKIDPTTSLLAETIIPDLEILAVVKKKNQNSPWAQDIKQAYQSQAFNDYLANNNSAGYWVSASQ
jgi:D-methionine transport system substrate-binding protein